jgi:hypothetical protein
MGFNSAFKGLNKTEDFQYRPMWGSDTNRNVHSVCRSTAGYFTGQSTQ